MTSERHMTHFDDCGCLSALYEKRITALERENTALREALYLMGPPHCDHLHHNKRDRHDWQTPCPVEARINALTANSDGGA
jgi:hypothetical protein